MIDTNTNEFKSLKPNLKISTALSLTVCVSKKINLSAQAIYLPQTFGGSHNYSAWTPTAWGSNCGSPLTQPSSVLPSHSLFPFISATETHQLSLDCCTHTHSYVCSRSTTCAAAKSDAWATAHALMGVAEGGLIELGSSSYMLLCSRVYVCVCPSSQLLVPLCLAPLFCNTAVYPFPPLSLLQVSYTALLTCFPSLFPLPTCRFRQSNVCLHIHMWEKTESSLTVARISLSSSHSCFNRLADILRYLVSGTLPGVRATLLRLHPVLMRLEGLRGVFDTWGPVWTLHPLKQSERKGYRSRLSALAGSRSQDNRSEAHVCALPFSFFNLSSSLCSRWMTLPLLSLSGSNSTSPPPPVSTATPSTNKPWRCPQRATNEEDS